MSEDTGSFEQGTGGAGASARNSHGHRRKAPDRPQRLRGAVAVVILLLVVAVLATGAVLKTGTEVLGCSGPRVKVAAEPDIAPLVIAAAKDVPGGCVSVAATVPTAILQSPAEGAGDPPDVWIPASTGWLARAAAGKNDVFPATGTSIARSPVMLAMPAPVADALKKAAPNPGWAVVAGAASSGSGLTLRLPSATNTTTGMLSVLAIRAAMAKTTTDQGIAQMRALGLRGGVVPEDTDVDALLRQLAGATDPAAIQTAGAFALTEQALWAYGQQRAAVPLTGVYPPDALVEADYPLVSTRATSADPDRAAIVAQLVDRLHTPGFATELVGAGFRPAAGRPEANAGPQGAGVQAGYVSPTTLPLNETASLVSQWDSYSPTPFHVLVLLDASGSMDEQVKGADGKTRTKVELVREAARQSTGLFGAETSLAMWKFDTSRRDRPYTELLPLGALGAPAARSSQRTALERAMTSYSALPEGGTPLYSTVLRGVDAMHRNWKDGAFSVVVVLSDGRDEASPFSIGQQKFLSQLRAAGDPRRPVPVFAIGYGQGADMKALQAMAAATGGQALQSKEPGDLLSAIAQLFLTLHR